MLTRISLSLVERIWRAEASRDELVDDKGARGEVGFWRGCFSCCDNNAVDESTEEDVEVLLAAGDTMDGVDDSVSDDKTVFSPGGVADRASKILFASSLSVSLRLNTLTVVLAFFGMNTDSLS